MKRILTIAATELRLVRRNMWGALATGLPALVALALAFPGADVLRPSPASPRSRFV